jgi:geranylgeranyl diphosphate synthase type II
MFDLNAYLESARSQINSALQETLNANANAGRIIAAMKYSLMAGGKRLRPVMCLAAAEAVGGRAEDVIKAACALEMIHTYSLIHDDLPAMDNDDLRRGRPTSHVAFGEGTAILTGDALLTMAFETLATIEDIKSDNAVLWLSVVHLFATAAGVQGMIQGQMMDIASEGTRLTLEELGAMHALKTGAIIEASVLSGSILGGGNHKQIERLRTYARYIGLAFQVTDDILNVEGNPEVMGKAVGTDKTRQKSTYPSIMGLGQSKEFAKGLINKALQSLEPFDSRSEPLRAIARYIIERKR